ncbi:hypothetical protein KEM48_002425 [Puccinia striiformis f. sp. tritici PST-130]|nr:hypothetical protein KEM48_002425 [Puccinia striiformis f. sp. tritici PST-130]
MHQRKDIRTARLPSSILGIQTSALTDKIDVTDAPPSSVYHPMLLPSGSLDPECTRSALQTSKSLDRMHVDGAEAGPWSDRYFSDHVLPDREPGMQDSQTLRRTQAGLGLGGSVEGTQGRSTGEKELESMREQLTTYIEAIRPKKPKSKLFQKKIDTNDPIERTSDLLQYAEQLQVIHKSIPTSPKDRLWLKWTDNPVMFDGREPPSPPAPTRESTLKRSKTMDTRVEKMMGKLSIKIPSFKGIGSRTRVVKADPPQEVSETQVSEVPKSSSRSPLAERIAPISPMAGTLFGDPLNIVMNMAAQDRLRSLHDLLDKIMPLEKARKRTGPDDQYYASLVLQLSPQDFLCHKRHDIIGHNNCSQKLQSLAAVTFPLFGIAFAWLALFGRSIGFC